MLQYIKDNRSTQFVIIVDDTSRLTRNIGRYFTLQRRVKAFDAEIHTPPVGSRSQDERGPAGCN
jgi:hypothetical protein